MCSKTIGATDFPNVSPMKAVEKLMRQCFGAVILGFSQMKESFFGTMKSEILYLKEFDSIEQFKQELFIYIEYYKHKRIKAKQKGLSPVQYRTHSQSVA